MNSKKKRFKNVGIFSIVLMVICLIVITINQSFSIAITLLLPVGFICFQFWLTACISIESSIFFIKKIKQSRKQYLKEKELLLSTLKSKYN